MKLNCNIVAVSSLNWNAIATLLQLSSLKQLQHCNWVHWTQLQCCNCNITIGNIVIAMLQLFQQLQHYNWVHWNSCNCCQLNSLKQLLQHCNWVTIVELNCNIVIEFIETQLQHCCNWVHWTQLQCCNWFNELNTMLQLLTIELNYNGAIVFIELTTMLQHCFSEFNYHITIVSMNSVPMLQLFHWTQLQHVAVSFIELNYNVAIVSLYTITTLQLFQWTQLQHCNWVHWNSIATL